MIIGIIGTIASGKDAVANHISIKYKFSKIVLSNFLRQEAVKQKLKVSRDVLRKIQAELRKKHGEDYLINKAIEKISKSKSKNFLLVGLRTPIDAAIAKEKLNAKIILVDAKPEIRYLRQKNRHRKGFSKTYEQFLHEEAIENATFDFHKTKKYADFRLDNNGTIQEMNKNIDRLMKRMKNN